MRTRKTEPQGPAYREDDDLPEGWVWARLGSVCDLNPPKPKPSALSPEAPVTFVPMPAVDAEAGAITRPEERPFSEVRKGFTAFADGDVIMAKITPCMENGKAAIARDLKNGLGFGSTEFHVLRSTEAVKGEWVYHFIRQVSFRKQAEEEMTGSVGQKRVPADFLSESEIPLAPLPEQCRIVEQVEALLTRVNAARARLARAPALLKAFRRAVLSAGCSGNLTGGNPVDWVHTTLGELFSVQTGATPLRKRSDYYTGGTVPWIKTGQVQNGEILHAEEFITELAIRETNAKVFPPGTILIAMYGEGRTRGQVARLRIRAATNQACAALLGENLPTDTMDFAYYFLRSAYEEMRGISVGGNQPNLSLGLIKTWPIVFPSLPEQREIVRRVEALFALADSIEAKVKAAQRRADALTQAILAKAFRGELVPTEAALARAEGRPYEAAAQLLDRVVTREENAGAAKPSLPSKGRRSLHLGQSGGDR